MPAHVLVPFAPTRTGEEELFEAHAVRLNAVVSRSVRASPANVDDACGFAWLQLVRHQPPRAVAFAWLCTTTIREAMRLDRRSARIVELDQVADLIADPVIGPDAQLELMVAGELIRAARLRPREARVVGLRVAGHKRREIVELTGESYRTVDRQLARAQRKPDDAAPRR